MHRLLLHERRSRLVVGQRVSPALGLHPRQPRLQQGVALAVHQHQPADILDLAHPVQELGIGDVRIGRVGDRHERFEAAGTLLPLALDLGDRGRGQRTPQPEVDHHLAGGHVAFLAVQLSGRHRRVGERVLHDRGHAAGRRRHRAGGEILALGVAGILEMGVHVDRARHHHQAGGVDQLVGAVARGLVDDR